MPREHVSGAPHTVTAGALVATATLLGVPDHPTLDRYAPLDPADLLLVQPRVTLTWDRDAGRVQLRVDAYDPGTGPTGTPDRPPGELPLDVLGGLAVDLDWSGANRLVKVTRVARDQSCGAPQ